VRKSISIRAEVEEELPQSQGFGMSAAGSMAASLALCGALGMDGDEALDMSAEAAHEAEVVKGGGLGDVAGQLAGGFEIRLKEGIPPYGMVRNLEAPAYFRRYRSDPEEKKVLVLWLKGGIPTRNILRDPDMREEISRIGETCLEELKEAPTLGNFMELSYRFASGTGLMSPRMRGLCDALKDAGGMASLCMLGNSLFALGLEEGDSQVAGILDRARRGLPVGGVRWTSVSERGPRLL
jgi:pantoate kinase